MPVAFVLINSEAGAEKQILNELKRMKEVKEAYVVYGTYDVIVKIEAETMEKLKEIITWKTRRLDNVISTLTMIVMDG
jgi:DNA-binding Lrp family transcriptional regulator